jgi:hypothetical protein
MKIVFARLGFSRWAATDQMDVIKSDWSHAEPLTAEAEQMIHLCWSIASWQSRAPS